MKLTIHCTKILYLFALPLYFLLIPLQAHANDPGMSNEARTAATKSATARKEINESLDQMAKQLAQLLAHPGFRGRLNSAIAKSKHRESILESLVFLPEQSKRPDAPPGLDKLSSKAINVSRKIKESRLWSLDGLDIYFPVKEHRKQWKGNKELYVAYRPIDDEANITQVIAYSVSSGKRVVLDIEVPPDVPTIMIAPEEHETHLATQPAHPKDVGAVKGPEPAGKVGPDSYFGVRYFRLDDDNEPWISGDPEIYSYYIQRGPGLTCNVTYKDLYWVNNENSWYYVWPYVARYFDSRYSNASYIRFYERDGGTYRVYDVTIEGQTCLFGKRDGDDHVITRWVYKSSYNFDYDYFYDWGDADVKLRKVH